MIDTSPDAAPLVRPLHWRRWYLSGFLTVFCLLLFRTSHTWNLAGNAIIRCTLWQHYDIEIRRLFISPQWLGPSSDSGRVALIVFLMHLAASGIGGLVTLGVGATIRRLRA
jgi:hypothetical protein